MPGALSCRSLDGCLQSWFLLIGNHENRIRKGIASGMCAGPPTMPRQEGGHQLDPEKNTHRTFRASGHFRVFFLAVLTPNMTSPTTINILGAAGGTLKAQQAQV